MTVTSVASSDFGVLTELRAQAAQNAKGAAPSVAKQFEGIFLQSMLKSMRMGQHFLDESSPFRGKDRETFEEMLDAQYASTIANGKGIGLATVLTKQLETLAPSQLNPMATDTTPSAVANKALTINPVAQSAPNQTQNESSVDEFVKSIWPKAKEAASVIGLDPKLLIAQAALETGWGKFVAKDGNGVSSNNLFNIKKGELQNTESVDVNTTEFIAGNPIKVTAAFRKYPTVEHSFDDYVSLIKGADRYQQAVENAGNPESYMNELYKAGYATDPQYSSKILSIYHGDELNQAIQRCELA